MEAARLVPPQARGSGWVRPVPAPPYRTAPSPRRTADDQGQATAPTARRPSTARTPGSASARPAEPRAQRPLPDPCATFRDLRRDYCYEVLDDLTR
ncbi:hypothetical protein [Nonomuraea roseola]|uniref:Uncharacterized protein n=1 Tax=Nonomuraea roseola TaxID=46179 RepID=A0ABV5Q9T1_9ACTN